MQWWMRDQPSTYKPTPVPILVTSNDIVFGMVQVQSPFVAVVAMAKPTPPVCILGLADTRPDLQCKASADIGCNRRVGCGTPVSNTIPRSAEPAAQVRPGRVQGLRCARGADLQRAYWRLRKP